LRRDAKKKEDGHLRFAGLLEPAVASAGSAPERPLPPHALNRYRDILGEFGIPTEAASEDPADKMKAPF
jgi:hypothetical protein